MPIFTWKAILSLLWKGRYVFLALGVLSAIVAYGYSKYREGVSDQSVAAQIENLKEDNAAKDRDIETKRKQDEVTARDISPPAMDRILHDGSF